MKKFYKSKFYINPIEVINNNGEIILIITDLLARKSIYSWYNLVEKNSNSNYINKCLLGGFLQEDIKKVLIIGVGGGAFIKYLEDHIKNVAITGIEIDEIMIKIAKNEFQIKTDNMIIGDYIFGIKKLIKKNEKYDLILFDIYGGDGEIPKSIIKENVLENIGKLLNKTGIFAINYSNFYILSNEIIKKTRLKLYNSIHKNLKKIFGNKFIAFLDGKNKEIKQGGNIVGIYNLTKKYSLNEIKNNYFNKINNNKILFDSKIIEGIYLDEKGLFLK